MPLRLASPQPQKFQSVVKDVVNTLNKKIKSTTLKYGIIWHFMNFYHFPIFVVKENTNELEDRPSLTGIKD